MTETIVELSEVFQYYPSPNGRSLVHALEPTSLHLERGECLGIVGESGSGKSTIAKIAGFLVAPTGGTATFYDGPSGGGRGVGIAEFRGRRRARIQMVFQDAFASLNPRMSVRSAVREAVRFHRVVGVDSMDSYVDGLLDRVGLSRQLADRVPGRLSGGQRQRAVIARALAVRPQVLIADEAVSALDVSVQAGILNLLQDVQSAESLSMIFISHDLGVVQRLADRIVVMHGGKVMEAGSAEQVYASPQHPYTRALLAAIPGKSGAAIARFDASTVSETKPTGSRIARP